MGTDLAMGLDVGARPAKAPSVRTEQAAVGVVLAVVIIAYVAFGAGRSYDDPFILYRYAQNLIDGHGWAYNPGTATPNAATSPGYVLLLAGLGRLGLQVPAASDVLFAVGMWAAGWFTYLTYRTSGGLFAAVLIVLSPQLVNVRGMETWVMLGLVAAAIWAAHRRLDVTTAVLLAALVLVRPDGVLLVPVLVGWRWLSDGRPPWRMATIAAAAVTAVGAGVLFTVGLPSTLAAKVAQAESGEFDPFLAGLVDLPGGAWAWWLVAAAGVLAVRTWRIPALWFAGLFAVAYGLLGAAAYPWYFAVPIYAVAVTAGMGLDRVRLGPLVLVAALSLSAVSPQMPGFRQMQATAGQWIEGNTPPTATVAASEIGLIGWHSQRTMIDQLGLLDPTLADRISRGDFSSWVDIHQPDYWVSSILLADIEQDALRAHGDDYQIVWERGGIAVRERLR